MPQRFDYVDDPEDRPQKKKESAWVSRLRDAAEERQERADEAHLRLEERRKELLGARKPLLVKQQEEATRKPRKAAEEEVQESASALCCGHTSRFLILVLFFWGLVALFAVVIMSGFTELGRLENSIIQG
jgi:transketolase